MEKLFLVVMTMVFTMPFFTGHTAEAAAKGRILLVASSQQTMALKNGKDLIPIVSIRCQNPKIWFIIIQILIFQ